MTRSAFFAFLWLLTQSVQAQSARRLQRSGDHDYERARYREAEQAYRRAAEQKPDDEKIPYNTGNAVYQQGDYAQSEKYFNQTLKTTKDPALLADAQHNLGNVYFKQEKYADAVQAYENSLRLRPGDADTKVNLQMAKKKLRQEQQKNNSQNQPQQPPPNTPQNQSPNQQPGQQPPPPPRGSEQPQQNPPPQEQDQPSEGRMSPDQARRLLETAVGPEDKKNARKYREQEPRKEQERTPKKDW